MPRAQVEEFDQRKKRFDQSVVNSSSKNARGEHAFVNKKQQVILPVSDQPSIVLASIPLFLLKEASTDTTHGEHAGSTQREIYH